MSNEQPKQEAAEGQAPAPQGFEEIVTELENKVLAAEQEKKELLDRLLRSAADFENFKKRAKKEIEDGAVKGREGVFREILPVIDNLERALKHAASDDPLAQGVRMVEKQLLQAMEKFGVARFTALGQPFDPAMHDAIQQMETADMPPNTVAQEYAAGYTLAGKLLRAAMVAVSKAPEAATPAGESEKN